MSKTVRAVFDATSLAEEQIAVSSISLVEIVYLAERRRIRPDTLDRLLMLLKDDALLVELNVERSILPALALIPREQVPDMPDRIIAAAAAHLGVSLISRDGKILASSVQTIW